MGDEERFASDPPILVGGGGSTLIWIRKDLRPEIIEYQAGRLKETPKPEHPENYHVYRFGDLEITNSTVRMKEGKHCQHGQLPHEHLTWFE